MQPLLLIDYTVLLSLEQKTEMCWKEESRYTDDE